MPVFHSPDTLTENKCDTSLYKGVLLAMRWIKPPQQHTPEQPAVHIITWFQSAEATNHSIREGVVIAGKRAWVRCLQKEPRRCLKSQSLTMNHLTADYGQQV